MQICCAKNRQYHLVSKYHTSFLIYVIQCYRIFQRCSCWLKRLTHLTRKKNEKKNRKIKRFLRFFFFSGINLKKNFKKNTKITTAATEMIFKNQFFFYTTFSRKPSLFIDQTRMCMSFNFLIEQISIFQ